MKNKMPSNIHLATTLALNLVDGKLIINNSNVMPPLWHGFKFFGEIFQKETESATLQEFWFRFRDVTVAKIHLRTSNQKHWDIWKVEFLDYLSDKKMGNWKIISLEE